MNDILPESKKSEPAMARNLWKVGVLGAVLVLGLVYAVFTVVPNLVGGQDMTKFKVGALSGLEVMPKPPIQPPNVFSGPDGSPVTLAKFKGKVVLVNLWATWCAPCVLEMPMLADLQAAFAGQDFAVVAISVDRADAAQEAKSRLAELSKGKLTFYHDPRMGVVYPMKARGFPTSVLYNRKGEEIARLAGEANWSSPEAHALISAALHE
jgi:thiol-disulfide isomerase/thioredoxin